MELRSREGGILGPMKGLKAVRICLCPAHRALKGRGARKSRSSRSQNGSESVGAFAPILLLFSRTMARGDASCAHDLLVAKRRRCGEDGRRSNQHGGHPSLQAKPKLACWGQSDQCDSSHLLHGIGAGHILVTAYHSHRRDQNWRPCMMVQKGEHSTQRTLMATWAHVA